MAGVHTVNQNPLTFQTVDFGTKKNFVNNQTAAVAVVPELLLLDHFFRNFKTTTHPTKQTFVLLS